MTSVSRAVHLNLVADRRREARQLALAPPPRDLVRQRQRGALVAFERANAQLLHGACERAHQARHHVGRRSAHHAGGVSAARRRGGPGYFSFTPSTCVGGVLSLGLANTSVFSRMNTNMPLDTPASWSAATAVGPDDLSIVTVIIFRQVPS